MNKTAVGINQSTNTSTLVIVLFSNKNDPSYVPLIHVGTHILQHIKVHQNMTFYLTLVVGDEVLHMYFNLVYPIFVILNRLYGNCVF